MLDTLVLNAALKTLCREFKVERDRQCVLRLATLLIQLSKSGITTPVSLSQTRDEILQLA